MLVKIGPFEFRECPVRFLDAEDEQLVNLVATGFELPTGPERLHLPARFVEGINFLAALKGGADGH